MRECDIIANLKDALALVGTATDWIAVHPACDKPWQLLCSAKVILNQCIKKLEKGGEG